MHVVLIAFSKIFGVISRIWQNSCYNVPYERVVVDVTMNFGVKTWTKTGYLIFAYNLVWYKHSVTEKNNWEMKGAIRGHLLLKNAKRQDLRIFKLWIYISQFLSVKTLSYEVVHQWMTLVEHQSFRIYQWVVWRWQREGTHQWKFVRAGVIKGSRMFAWCSIILIIRGRLSMIMIMFYSMRQSWH